MVILIGGAGCAGKTLMAQKLLEIYKIPYLSIDHLKMGLFRAGNCGFTPCDDRELLAEKLWPVLKGIIMTNIENSQNIIIEGCYLLPAKIAELEPEYMKHIVSFFMIFSNDYIKKNFSSAIIGNMGVIEARCYDGDWTEEQYISDNMRLKALCAKNGANCFEISKNYETETAEIYKWIESKLKKL